MKLFLLMLFDMLKLTFVLVYFAMDSDCKNQAKVFFAGGPLNLNEKWVLEKIKEL